MHQTRQNHHPRKTLGAHPAAVVDDVRLLQSIRILEAHGGSDGGPSVGRITPCRRQSFGPDRRVRIRRIMRSLAYFLELAVLVNSDLDPEARKIVATALEARVLSCIHRFWASRERNPSSGTTPRMWSAWYDRGCSGQTSMGSSCTQRFLASALTCFIYTLSKVSSMAPVILRSKLHQILFELLGTSNKTDFPQSSQEEVSNAHFRDVAIGVDPFDWTTRSLVSVVEGFGDDAAIFILPVGARSLAHVFNSNQVPSDEREELEIQLRSQRISNGVMPLVVSRSHQMPAMFTFPVQQTEIHEECFVCPLCSPAFDAEIWKVILQNETTTHFAIRTIVTLASNLPSASPERKQFVRDGAYEYLKRYVSVHTNSQSFLSDLRNAEHQTPRLSSHSSQNQASGSETKRTPETTKILKMAVAGLEAFTSLESGNSEAFSSGPAQLAISKPGFSCNSPSITHNSLQDRLQAVSMLCYQEAVQGEQIQKRNQRDIIRSRQRQIVRSYLHQAEELRVHLLRSLRLMTAGRPHPDPSQTVTSWLDSFSTIEKREQQRKDLEEQRQRRILELQYQIDERRRHERDERERMSQNDFNVSDSREKALQDAMKFEILRVQEELRAFAIREEQERLDKVNVDIQLRKRQEAIALANKAREEINQNRENELMKREDRYYAEKILREKKRREDVRKQRKLDNPLDDHQKRIEHMRVMDAEKKNQEREAGEMRSEDLSSRQMRFRDIEDRKKQAENQWRERRAMQQEERELRLRWEKLDDAMAKAASDEKKRQRAEERSQRRAQERLNRQAENAWTTAYDEYGNIYYFNTLTGLSQWHNPFGIPSV